MRRLLVVMAFVLGLDAGAARAQSFPMVYTSGHDILHVGEITARQAVERGSIFMNVGYMYRRTGLFFIDIWRSDGEFVLYSGSLAEPLDPADAASLGFSVPLAYHLPPGLLILLGAGELLVITRTRRRAKVTLAIGGGLIALSGVLYLGGLDVGFAVPLLLGLHHVVGTLLALRAHGDEDTTAAELGLDDAPPARPEPRVELMPSPPMVETDPFRSPPRVRIAAVQTTRKQTDAPIVHDPNADKPKLLG